jgi:hypothetical protein
MATLVREQRVEAPGQGRRNRPELGAMDHRQERQQGLAAQGEPHDHVPTVVVGSSPTDEAASLHAIDQFDRAVVLDLQALRQDADRRLPAARHTLHGQQQLVLLGLEAG